MPNLRTTSIPLQPFLMELGLDGAWPHMVLLAPRSGTNNDNYSSGSDPIF